MTVSRDFDAKLVWMKLILSLLTHIMILSCYSRFSLQFEGPALLELIYPPQVTEILWDEMRRRLIEEKERERGARMTNLKKVRVKVMFRI